MTKAKLTVWIDWDPDKTGIGANLPGPNAMEFDIEVTKPEDEITIKIMADGVVMNTPHEPKLVTLPESKSESDEAGQFAVEWDNEHEMTSGHVGSEEGDFASRNTARAAAEEHAGTPLHWTTNASGDEEATADTRTYFVVKRDIEEGP